MNDILKAVLEIEHQCIANKLGFINQNEPDFDENLMYQVIGCIDRLTKENDEYSRRKIIFLSAVLWTYKKSHWTGLKDYLILVLSKSGFAPSSIMVDDEYSDGKYSSMDSFMNQLAVSLYQYENEITVGSRTFALTGFQKAVWEQMKKNTMLGISAPTSSGKSFIILLKMIDLFLSGDGCIIYIVPTLSLVAQVYSDLKNMLKLFNLANVNVYTGLNNGVNTCREVYILTQEKAIAAFSQGVVPFVDIKLLVVDEIQNIERVADDSDLRSKVLYDTLIEFRHFTEIPLCIIAGPRIDGLKQLGLDIFGEDHIADEMNTKDSPVASITYAICKKDDGFYFNQYCELIDTPLSIKIENDSMVKGYGKVTYTTDYYDYLSSIVSSFRADEVNLIFAPTAGLSHKIAKTIAKDKARKNEPLLITLSEYIKSTVHEDYDLSDFVNKGIGYHNGKMPMHIRFVIEHAVKRKLINNIVCTTTLMQGVNLPAQNVVIRNPDLKIRNIGGVKPQLTNYEIANLRGRAGRLLKDFVGRTFVLDSSAFASTDSASSQNIFPDAHKELTSGYGARYHENKEEIDKALLEPKGSFSKDSAYLVTYIRSAIVRLGDAAKQQFDSVGIALDDNQFMHIRDTLSNLNVSPQICKQNRYWDPFVLESLFECIDQFDLPTSAHEGNIEDKILDLLLYMKKSFPFYYNRYWDPKFSDMTNRSICISAKEWLREKALSEILACNYFDTPEKVETRINILQTSVSYGLPMLLKPLYDMKEPESSFLKFIEYGAYNPITRRLIELNIPRECAVLIYRRYFNNASQDEFTDDFLISRLKEISSELNYWEKIQVENLF